MIYHPTTPLEAVTLRKQNADTAVYLAGGTDDLRLNGSAQGKDLIDINALGLDDIFVQDGKLYIGARCTFNQVIDSELVPEFIKEAAHFCASFTKRSAQVHHTSRRGDEAHRRISAERLQAAYRVCGAGRRPYRLGQALHQHHLQPCGCDGGSVRGYLCPQRLRQ